MYFVYVIVEAALCALFGYWYTQMLKFDFRSRIAMFGQAVTNERLAIEQRDRCVGAMWASMIWSSVCLPVCLLLDREADSTGIAAVIAAWVVSVLSNIVGLRVLRDGRKKT